MDRHTGDGVLPVIRRKPNKNSPEDDLRFRYDKMVLELSCNPRAIIQFQGLFSDILKPLAETKGELHVLANGNRVFFARQGLPFTDFCVIPMKVIQEHFIDKVRYYIELLILSNSSPPKSIILESKRLGSCQWIEDLGVGYLYEKWGLELLKTLIKMLSKYAPVEDVYEYSGWMPDGSDCYIMEGHKLSGERWNINKAKVSCEHTFKMLEVAPYSLTVPLLAVELLSLVHSRMVENGMYFKGVCCIVAPTQSFKTTLASLFFDYKSGREANINFEATTAAIVRTIGNVRDSTIIVDDYKPGATKAESNEMTLKLSKLIRMCSDDSGGIKKAGTQNSTVANIAHCLTVVTAEQIQLKVQSTLARLLILEANRKSVNKDKLTYFQVNHHIYRTFIESYIMYISRQGVETYCENLVKKFIQERDTLRKKLTAKDVTVDNRTNDMCVWLYISFGEFLKYALQVKAINKVQLDDFAEESQTIFLSIMEQQAERVFEMDDTRRFFKGLQVLLETKEAHIGTLQARNTSYSTVDSKSAIGFTKQGFVYLKNGVAFQQVVSYYRRFGKELAVSESTLRKTLADNSYIVPKSEKSYIFRLYVNHETYQCIQFEEKKFNQLLNGGGENGTENEREIPGNWGLRQNADKFLGGRD